MSFNTTFRPTTSSPPGRSPSPPRRFVEPLSPRSVSVKPVPIEPNFNYPPINNNVHYTVQPEQAPDEHNATPKSRVRGSGYKSGHHRTPSTIDTLAEAALAMSPLYHAPAVGTYQDNGTPHIRSVSSGHGMSEPPHKRARSEIYPSPMVSQYASRPATSYEHGQQRHGGAAHAGHTYDSRMEEASLLLNFRTGGISVNSQHLPPPPVPATHPSRGSRPHANSLPLEYHASRSANLAPQTVPLSPVYPQHNGLPHSTLASPKQATQALEPHTRPASRLGKAAELARNGYGWSPMPVVGVSRQVVPTRPLTLEPQTRTCTSASATDVISAKNLDTSAKNRRNGTRGKSKAQNRKGISEKPASRRVASRKKTPVPSIAHNIAHETLLEYTVDQKRRKSVSDAAEPAFGTPESGSVRRAKSVPPGTRMVIRIEAHARPSRRSKQTVDNIICAGCETTRETSSLNGELDQWISCNGCSKWFHIDCAGFKKASEVRDVDKFFCAPCEPTHGSTTYVRKSSRAHVSVDYAELQRGVLKTSEESMEHHYIQPIKDGTFQFDPETFPRMRPELVTKDFLERSGSFVEPICIPAEWNPRPWLETPSLARDDDALHEQDHLESVGLSLDDYEYDTVPNEGQDRLDMVMPENLTVRQVCNLVGPGTPLEVIDVKTQDSGAKWTLGRWADYYEEKTEDKPIRNVISLEVSQTKLGKLLRRPKVVRDIDLQDQVWPRKEIDLGKYPKVQYYCLMSVADSYTDFHIDFGGSSVYYHIIKGKKTFFFIPPKTKHLKAYEEWNDSPQQNFTFLPSITKECYRMDLSEGDTMLIPSGWIHAVWTPETSLVIGGNFLNRMSYKNQFKIVDIEKNNNTPIKFRYPFFQRIMWYTTIQYLEQDPLPDAVSQLFLEGKKFERLVPIWADYDGDVAANDDRVGAKNSRYYSQAEIEGLPELCNYIFRTVMLVMGRVEGVSADQTKRINASIPKGHGEPLQIAKTFALWVAWKTGNEDPPAWAHPDAVLPASKEEGTQKKLSARALKEMERKEAIAAWRVVPDRQSARVKAAGTGANGPMPMATPERTSSYHPPSSPQATQHPSQDTSIHQMALSQAMPVAHPMHLMMPEMTSHHISTPKTSVLGPKRVACDACRKRRIRCKHKDLVMQAPIVPHMLPSDLHETILVTTPRPPRAADYLADTADAQQDGMHPGTSAYINASIPMSINGSPLFGDSAKRGRSKACFECRKSKRRCIHDENGNVDPIKAAETPVPRGSNSSKKRSSEDGSPSQNKKKMKQDSPEQSPLQRDLMNIVALADSAPTPHQQTPAQHRIPIPDKSAQPPPAARMEQHEQPALDPNLFAPYPDTVEHGVYHQSYPYPANPYHFQSLEQIANEVLDMNHEDDVHIFDGSSNESEAIRPDESVDSAVSLPGSDDGKQMQPIDAATDQDVQLGPAKPTTNLPLYRPPQASSQSPEQIKRLPLTMATGFGTDGNLGGEDHVSTALVAATSDR